MAGGVWGAVLKRYFPQLSHCLPSLAYLPLLLFERQVGRETFEESCGLPGTWQGARARRVVQQAFCPEVSGEGVGCTVVALVLVREGRAVLGQKQGSEHEQALRPVLCSAAPFHVHMQDHPGDSSVQVAVRRFLLQAAGGLKLSSVTGGDAKAAGQCQGDGSHPGAGDTRRHQRGRAEHRRHTITNGVDFSMLKHMKELEQEKDFLLQGLELVERTREWYHQHIQFMQERQRLLGKNKTTAVSLGLVLGVPSHLGRLVPKLQEVNRCLGDLLSTAHWWVSHPSTHSMKNASVFLLCPMQEVTDKSERITQLEQEKSALIKQLFEARARNNNETSQLDSTFI
uniref:Suppressor APC domain containing 2 n=1 Tax=Athene cunicularia TaxID=194338 RepID=A0A663NBM5_ATHCN